MKRKRKLILPILALLLLSGCAYNQTTIYAGGNVYCTSNTEKPVEISSALQGNVPIQGGTIDNSNQQQFDDIPDLTP